MERVYLLLRNNNQTGPFTIGELLQQQLRPSDMIWIEGRSTAWTYLSELELTPFLKASETASGQTRSADEIERKAEELRQRVLVSAAKTYFPSHPVEVDGDASPYKLPESEIEFVDHRKERRMRNHTVVGELFLTILVIGLFMVGIYKGKSFLSVRKSVPNAVATQLNSHDEHAAQKNKRIESLPILAIDTVKRTDSAIVMQTAKPKPSVNKKIVVDSVSKSALQPPSQTENKEETKTETATIQAPEENLVKDKITVPDSNKTAIVKQEEKKGFLRGLFKKKKKEENPSRNETDQ